MIDIPGRVTTGASRRTPPGPHLRHNGDCRSSGVGRRVCGAYCTRVERRGRHAQCNTRLGGFALAIPSQVHDGRGAHRNRGYRTRTVRRSGLRLVDSADGKAATAKNPKKWPTLFGFRATSSSLRAPVRVCRRSESPYRMARRPRVSRGTSTSSSQRGSTVR